MSQKTDPAASWISDNLGTGAVVKSKVHGASGWASSSVLETETGARYFVKTSSRDGSMFAGEALGLQAMYDTHTLRVPKVHHHGPLPGGGSFIVMDYLNLTGACDQAELGRKLAQMHSAKPADPNAAQGRFGFSVDNTIGGTPQPNGWMDNWVDFFRERRLKHQLKLSGNGRLSQLAQPIVDNLESFFEGVTVTPSVLHGDLWSGNIGAADGQPVIYDPATYYGHSEAEFGMSWCAGFSGAFYKAYHEVIPRAPGFEDRRNLYLLYHYLNHYNLFGDSYFRQCEATLEDLNKRLK